MWGIFKFLGLTVALLCAAACSKKTTETDASRKSEDVFRVQIESVSTDEDGVAHQVWVRWSLNGREQGVKKVAEGVGGLGRCAMGQECPPPKGSPVKLTGYYGGVSSDYELVRRGDLVVIEDRTEDSEACGPEGCGDAGGPRRIFELPVPKGAAVKLKAVE